MRFNNETISKPKPTKIVVYRDPPLILWADAVLDYSEFEELAPEPRPPITKNIKTGITRTNVTDSVYVKRVEEHNKLRVNWLVFTSLQATPELVFETVDSRDPTTWDNAQIELAECFTPYEVGEIVSGVMDANAPSKESYEEALANFPATPPEEEEDQPISLMDEPKNTGIGDPVSDLEFDPMDSQPHGTI